MEGRGNLSVGICVILSTVLNLLVFLTHEEEQGDFLFKIEISGGIMGINREILINKDGNALFLDKKTKEKREFIISPKEIKEFEILFYRIKKKEIGKPYPDCIFYKISSREKSIIIIPSPNMRNESFLKLLEFINKWLLFMQRG